MVDVDLLHVFLAVIAGINLLTASVFYRRWTSTEAAFSRACKALAEMRQERDDWMLKATAGEQ